MLNSNRLDNYNDIAALQSLKAPKAKQDGAAIKEVAKQFESLFVSMMLKSMREANKGFSEGNMLSSKDTEFYQEMFDSQISVSLSGDKGFGLAEVIEKQLTAKAKAESQSDAEFSIGSLDQYQRKAFPARDRAKLNEAVEQVDKALSEPARYEAGASLDASVANNEGNPASVVEPSALAFNSPSEFVRSMLPHAERVESETGISARLMIAQSALETGWGQKPILNKDGSSSFNLFGIKASAAWQGPKAEVLTTEFYDGLPIKQRAEFRSYGSYTESFRDYAQFLKSNPRYEPALALREDPVAFARALQSSGYATDPNYANKIEGILGRHIPESADVDALESGER
jgi:flagellar protein FlgJ